MTAIQAIFFDCDGTLVDSEKTHYLALRAALENQGFTLSHEEYIPHVGNPMEAIAEVLTRELGCDAERLIEDKRSLFWDLQQSGLPPIHHVVDFVHRIAKEKRELKFAVASAASKVNVLAHLRHLNIDPIFDLILSGHDDLSEYNDPEGVNKPKPYIYQHAAKKLQLLPKQCIVIEVSSLGIQAGKSAGCFTIAVPNEYTLKQDLSHADLRIDSFNGLDLDKLFHLITKTF